MHDDYRSLADDGRIEPFQGANRPTGYPGDRQIRDRDGVTIQVHQFATVYQDSTRRNVVALDVPLVAVVLPGDVARGLVVQRQGGTA